MDNESGTNKNYDSNFMSEFSRTRQLGKGGFGVVFEAIHKISDLPFAVKRIQLDDSPEEQKKALREVTTLAQLDHPNIVRYYNSWIESPPYEWQKEADNIFLEGNSTSLNEFSEEELDFYEESETETDQNMSFNMLTISSIGVQTDDVVISPRRKKKKMARSEISMNNNVMRVNKRKISKKSAESHGSEAFSGDSHKNVFYDHHKPFEIGFTQTEEKVNFVFSSTDRISEENSDSDEERCKKSLQNILAGPKVNLVKEYFSEDQGAAGSSKNFTTHIAGLQKFPKVLKKKTKSKPRICHFLYIQMELCQNINLAGWLKDNSKMRDMKDAFRFFSEILKAIEFIHEKGYIHRDLKPSNIFFSTDGIVKVGDFGLAKTILEEHTRFSECLDEACSFTKEVGTQPYMSPEQLAHKKYDKKVDVYSLGLIFLELLKPFSTDSEKYRFFSDVKNDIFDDNICHQFEQEVDLIKMMIKKNPEERIATEEIRPKLEGDSNKVKYIQRSTSKNNNSTVLFGQALEFVPILSRAKWNICLPIIIYDTMDLSISYLTNYLPSQSSYYEEIYLSHRGYETRESRYMRSIPPMSQLKEKAVAILKLRLVHSVLKSDNRKDAGFKSTMKKNTLSVRKIFANCNKKPFPKNPKSPGTKIWYLHVSTNLKTLENFDMETNWYVKLEYSYSKNMGIKIVNTGIKTLPSLEETQKGKASVLRVRLPYTMSLTPDPENQFSIKFVGTVQPMLEVAVNDFTSSPAGQIISKKKKRKRKKTKN